MLSTYTVKYTPNIYMLIYIYLSGIEYKHKSLISINLQVTSALLISFVKGYSLCVGTD